MASGGVFSRGAVFGAGAAEIALSDRVWATAALSQSYSLKADALSAALGLQRARTDLSGGVTCALRPGVAAYGSLGRTISTRDNNSATVSLAGGISFGLKRPSFR
jgi:hypothetical protein